MATLSHSLYNMPWLAPRMDAMRAIRLSNKLFEQGYVKERLELSLKKFFLSIRVYYQTIRSSTLTNAS